MKVVGLSATIILNKTQLSPDAPPEYLLLYEATPDSFILKAQVQWDETDTAGRLDARVWLNPLGCQNSSGVDGLSYGYIYGPNHPYYAVKVFDYYFDKPIVVYDSFYVGGTDHSCSGIFSPEPIPPPPGHGHYIAFRPTQAKFDTTCLFPIALWKLYHY
ncbi:MAG: hypothetical protein J6P67_05440, partial [Bacteroidaceae bacterium]|nr:hypothetical protein [Bacteroidaceae bacterium]